MPPYICLQVLQERRQAAEGKVEWESEGRGRKVISTSVVKVVFIGKVEEEVMRSSKINVDATIKVAF